MNDSTIHREVPAYTVARWQGRVHPYCVVIPVINEGERIASLLKRMSELSIAEQLDILIVDGGSTDGSLSDDVLDQGAVRGLLVKTGAGKLSAQLRCAYSFALDAGYKGVVTIDGNDKDDPAAIVAFVEKLEDHYDFVQGSRFLPDGVAENTPVQRLLAIRLIHAPLLSMASGFRWTDTTQGFRAYSRRVLEDLRVALFRDVFRDYELLAYMSYRVPKLGYRCAEVPTARRYPRGQVPTKIKGFKGSLGLIRVLVAACAGLYDPSEGTASERQTLCRRPLAQNGEEPSLFSDKRPSRVGVMTAILSALTVFAGMAYVAAIRSSQLPIVDGWAVLNRVMDLEAGHLRWDQFLLRPHGAHLHSIIYALSYADFLFASGSQTLTYAFSIAASAALCWLLAHWLVRAQGPTASLSGCVALGAAVGAAVGNLADMECMIHPFQAVLTVSRVAYLALLMGLVQAAICDRPRRYSILMPVAAVATTFHGTGMLVALCIAFLPWFLRKPPSWWVMSCVPLVMVLVVKKIYTLGDAEIAGLRGVLDLQSIPSILMSMAAYFGTPFALLQGPLGQSGVIAIGAGMGLSLTVTMLVAGRSVYEDLRGGTAGTPSAADVGRISTMAIIALWSALLIASAGSAALMWLVRARMGVAGDEPYRMVLNTARYVSYAGLGPIVLLCLLLVLRRNPSDRPRISAYVLAGVITVTAVWCSAKAVELYSQDDGLGIAAAAISAGVSAIEQDADGVWPMAREDWFWVTALPKTVDFMKSRCKAVWRDLPRLGEQGGQSFPRGELSCVETEVRALGANDSVTKITAEIPDWDATLPAQAILRPLTNRQGTVVGYACILRQKKKATSRVVVGFCPGRSIDASDLYIGPLTGFPYLGDAEINSVSRREITSHNLTDSNWTNGIWTLSGAAMFFTDADSVKGVGISAGDYVVFAKSGRRRVAQVTTPGPYVNIAVDGPTLDPQGDGYPNAIKLEPPPSP